MTATHALRKPRPIALAAAGTGLAGVLALTGGGVDYLAQVAAKTIIVVGGANDPTGKDQWTRISGDYTGPAPVFVQYPAVFGIGYPGFALSSDFKHTYAQSNEIGAAATVDAIAAAKQNPDEDVVVYTISQGADVVGLAVLRYGKDHPRPSDGSAKLTFIEQGSPSFIRSGAWSVIPAGIPGLHNGPVRNDGASGATVVSICVKGDIGCAMGLNPVVAMVYLVPGFMMHGTVYTAENIGRYSPTSGEPFTPGSTPETPIGTRTEIRNGNTVTVETYEDGTVKRTWTEDNTTWVSIDKGENPWGWMLRRSGIAVPKEFDQLLNTLIPVPEPGDSGLIPGVPTASPADRTSSPARHGTDRPDAVTVAELVAREEQKPAPAVEPVAPTEQATVVVPARSTPPTEPVAPPEPVTGGSVPSATSEPQAEIPAPEAPSGETPSAEVAPSETPEAEVSEPAVTEQATSVAAETAA
ncbi:PE-PPE domain-containing protein [Tsukamurella ocularis]|uniref:PE-PPE domain-containing protein n=1 Tax=Tsukamurella ocularis TaxID=1970234 RepID=UPI00216976E8|nr:PE-PPE domain-containing protein [Tsukamurella ocularis]MCS3779701.1 hypothetical protein [Tsukamurella ocularis]MCS3788899.1 hypothetical protein [Tsukamurella ocularis]MCS3850109.1 hypothetical protein [Tsukamurella ocularis]